MVAKPERFREIDLKSAGNKTPRLRGRGVGRLATTRVMRIGLAIALVVAALTGPLSGSAVAHDNLPAHAFSGGCAADDFGTYVRAGHQDLRVDYRAGHVYGFVNGFNLYYEQFVGYRLVVSWKDSAGNWQQRFGSWVKGRNGSFAQGDGFVQNPSTGVWEPIIIGNGFGFPAPGTLGRNALTGATVPGDGTYWVGVQVYWFPLNLVNNAKVVRWQMQGGYSHWLGWTTVTCRTSIGNYGLLFSDTTFTLR